MKTLTTCVCALFLTSVSYAQPDQELSCDFFDAPGSCALQFDQYNGPGTLTGVRIGASLGLLYHSDFVNDCGFEEDVIALHLHQAEVSTPSTTVNPILTFEYSTTNGMLGDTAFSTGENRSFSLGDGFGLYWAVDTIDWVGNGTVDVVYTELDDFWGVFPTCFTQTLRNPFDPDQTNGSAYAFINVTFLVEFNFQNLLELLKSWSQPVSSYDLDRSGVVDMPDLMILLNNWGNGEPAPIAPPVIESQIETTLVK